MNPSGDGTDLDRFLLDRLARTFGDAARAAVVADCGLLARLDQLTAGIGDLLAPVNRRPSLATLGSYADGLTDTATLHGWRMPTGEVDWRTADEIAWRLVAICQLAYEAGTPAEGA